MTTHSTATRKPKGWTHGSHPPKMAPGSLRGSSVVPEKALHRKPGSLALAQVPCPLWASLSRRTGRELDSGQCLNSSPGMPTPGASFTPSCSPNPVAPPLV
ncbi:unnamed protein product [Rangifer tarandus platyrhynchus]|uniref:Uncharacterized protein n=1 Tax=Rangifer tarandus platyrhynchus TaxID=3082113 RepID=A0AC60A039_RANTA